jgi:hypothetical protein
MVYRVVIIDRSILAVNMYRLLLRPLGAFFLMAKRYEEARPWFFRKDKIDLAVFNSNTFGKKFDEYVARFESDEPLAGVPKIFLCRDTEKGWQKRLSRLSNSRVMERPFHPDDFLKAVKGVIKKE